MNSTGEPIPGAVPPDATKPRERIRVPEGALKGIKVEVPQPDIIYKLAVELGKGSGGKDNVGLHNSNMNDAFLRTTISNLRSLGAQRENEYNLRSWYHLAEDVGQRQDYGYYGQERVATLQKMLEEKSFTVRFQERPSFSGPPTNYLVFAREGQQYELYLGFGSRQKEEESIKRVVEADRSRNPTKPGYSETYDLPKVEKGLTQNLIWLRTDPRKLDLGEETSSSSAYDKEPEFTAYIQKYTKVYEDVTGILYKEAGVEPPKNQTIIFRPPQDTLTPVASTKTENLPLVKAPVQKPSSSDRRASPADAAEAQQKNVSEDVNPARTELTALTSFINTRLRDRLVGLIQERIPFMPTNLYAGRTPQEVLENTEKVLLSLGQNWRERTAAIDPNITQTLDNFMKALRLVYPRFQEQAVPFDLVQFCKELLNRDSQTADEARAREQLIIGVINTLKKTYRLK